MQKSSILYEGLRPKTVFVTFRAWARENSKPWSCRNIQKLSRRAIYPGNVLMFEIMWVGQWAYCYPLMCARACSLTLKVFLVILVFYAYSLIISDVNECVMYPGICENNSTCTNTFGDYECDCLPGFAGKNCSQGTWFIHEICAPAMTYCDAH